MNVLLRKAREESSIEGRKTEFLGTVPALYLILRVYRAEAWLGLLALTLFAIARNDNLFWNLKAIFPESSLLLHLDSYATFYTAHLIVGIPFYLIGAAILLFVFVRISDSIPLKIVLRRSVMLLASLALSLLVLDGLRVVLFDPVAWQLLFFVEPLFASDYLGLGWWYWLLHGGHVIPLKIMLFSLFFPALAIALKQKRIKTAGLKKSILPIAVWSAIILGLVSLVEASVQAIVFQSDGFFAPSWIWLLILVLLYFAIFVRFMLPLWLFAVALGMQDDMLFNPLVDKAKKPKVDTILVQNSQPQNNECLVELFADSEEGTEENE